MESEHGRARVFDQWGDDDETIEIAIETCPVDCIHYIPYQELVDLEVGRREQNINPKARLVNQSNDGGGGSYTGTQQISGNMGSRCTNCPSRGCKDCESVKNIAHVSNIAQNYINASAITFSLSLLIIFIYDHRLQVPCLELEKILTSKKERKKEKIVMMKGNCEPRCKVEIKVWIFEQKRQ